MKQANIFYNGTIQGVGFRYTVRTLAKECHVVGWVKNLPDGRVELVACGEKEKVEIFKVWLWKGSPASSVTDVESEIAALQNFFGFDIIF